MMFFLNNVFILSKVFVKFSDVKKCIVVFVLYEVLPKSFGGTY